MNPLFCLSPSAPYFFHLFLLAFLFVLVIGIFSPEIASIQRAPFKLDDLLCFFHFSSIMCPLTSYSFTLLGCFMDEWIRPIIVTLFWFSHGWIKPIDTHFIYFFLDEWTKPTTLTSLCFFMDEWIKQMRLTLLWFFMDELSHWHSLYFVFSWMKNKWWPPWLKQKLTWTIIEHMIMSWFHPLCRYYRKCHNQLDSPRAEKGHKLREYIN